MQSVQTQSKTNVRIRRKAAIVRVEYGDRTRETYVVDEHGRARLTAVVCGECSKGGAR
jgi:hypothetical protein